MTLTVELTNEQVAQLNELASETGRNAGDLMQEAVRNLLEYNAWFKDQVRIGHNQIERGELLEDAEVRKRLDRMFQP
jgi:predicted transcriptional regulator